jgi:pilus assembly protein Flp/PilA
MKVGFHVNTESFTFNKPKMGQGLVEYALILVLVAIVVIAVLLILVPNIGNTFGKVNSSLSGLDAAAAPIAIPPIAIPATAIPPTATPIPIWRACANEMFFAVLVGQLQCDMERTVFGLPKPAQMESLATIVLLVTLPMVF